MSIRIAIIAMIPNVFPVFMYFGVLGWTGITLNVTTGLVADIVLGIAVDDTVHFLTNFNRFARKTGSEIEGVRATLLHVARPVSTTTIALICGFGVLGLSSLNQQAEFGKARRHHARLRLAHGRGLHPGDLLAREDRDPVGRAHARSRRGPAEGDSGLPRLLEVAGARRRVDDADRGEEAGRAPDADRSEERRHVRGDRGRAPEQHRARRRGRAAQPPRPRRRGGRGRPVPRRAHRQRGLRDGLPAAALRSGRI